MDAVTITSPGSGKTPSYEVVFVATSSTTGNIDVREWNAGKVMSKDPADTDNSYALQNITVVGDQLECDTTALFMTPHIEMELSEAGKPLSVSLAITHAWMANSTKVLPLDQAHWDAAKAFLENWGKS